MRCLRWILLGFTGLLVVVAPGCGPAPATVRGEVTVDGVPVDLGNITYSPADANGVPGTVDIKDGKYEMKTVIGKKFVAISALKVIDKKKDSDSEHFIWVDITEERLPPRYNTETELRHELVPGDNVKDWHLHTKK